MLVKIIAGMYGYRDEKNRLRPKSEGDVVDVKDEEAKRLINLGVAEYATETSEVTGMGGSEVSTVDNTPETENASNEADEGEEINFDDMTVEQLKGVAKQMGINTSKLRSKKALIDAINDASVELPEA